MDILIVKTSAIGDIIQCLDILDYLKRNIENCNIDWVVSTSAIPLVSAHPFIRNTICFDIKKKGKNRKSRFSRILHFYRDIRKKTYDIVFDLQGNSKSGLITMMCKAKHKVGFAYRSVAEWPNLLSTNIKYNVNKSINIQSQYLQILQKYFDDDTLFIPKKRLLNISPKDEKKLFSIINDPKLNNKSKAQIIDKKNNNSFLRILVCSSSKWKNKEIDINTLRQFLSKINKALNVSFLFLWGDEREKKKATYLNSYFSDNSIVLDKLKLPLLQHLMRRLDLVIAMDSCALHLCGSVNTSSLSIFGPTSAAVYNPLGENHIAYQGKCHLNILFDKRCPKLRTCTSPKCIQDIDYRSLYQLLNKSNI